MKYWLSAIVGGHKSVQSPVTEEPQSDTFVTRDQVTQQEDAAAADKTNKTCRRSLDFDVRVQLFSFSFTQLFGIHAVLLVTYTAKISQTVTLC